MTDDDEFTAEMAQDLIRSVFGPKVRPGVPFPGLIGEFRDLCRMHDEAGSFFDMFGWVHRPHPALGGECPLFWAENYCAASGTDAIPDRLRVVLRRDLMSERRPRPSGRG